jgi:hypothetical protein
VTRKGSLVAEFSPDDRTLALWAINEDRRGIEFLDATTGKRRSAADLDFREIELREGMGFSPDGSLWCYCRFPRTLVVVEVASGRVLWQKAECGMARFAGAGTVLHHGIPDRPLELLDAHTGRLRARLPQDFDTGDAVPQLTSDGRYFVIQGWHFPGRGVWFVEKWLRTFCPKAFTEQRCGALVMDITSGCELFRAVAPGPVWFDQPWLSDDGSTLVTQNSDSLESLDPIMVRVWDVHPQRAWLWALAASIATWFALQALRASNRIRARKMRAPGGQSGDSLFVIAAQ